MFDKKHEIKISLVLIAVFIVVITIFGNDLIEITLFEPMQNIQQFFDDTFTRIGFAVIFLYEFIPDGFKFISNAGFYGNLISKGVPDYLLIIIPAIGDLGGAFLMYSLGRLNLKWWKKQSFASENHLMHRHRLIIFFIVPFAGMGGTFIMILAGHQKINFLKIMPILFAGSLIRMMTFVYPFIFQLNLG